MNYVHMYVRSRERGETWCIKRLLDYSPLCVAGGNGWFSCRVCLLSLLQQHIVENTSDVNVDIVLHALQNVHVGLYRVQKLGRLCYLRGFWTVHHHTSQCSGKPGLQVLVQVFPEAKLSFVDGYFKLRAVPWCKRVFPDTDCGTVIDGKAQLGESHVQLVHCGQVLPSFAITLKSWLFKLYLFGSLLSLLLVDHLKHHNVSI